MKETKIQYKGIARALSNEQIEDGFLDEAINARKRHGKLTTRGHATYLFKKPDDNFDKIFYHDQEGIGNYIGYLATAGEIRLINTTSGTSSVIVSPVTGNDVDVVFLKRTMIIISDEGVKTFIYTQENGYVQTESLPVPDVVLKRTTAEIVGGEATEASTWAGVLGSYWENLNRLSINTGKLYGSVMYMVAYRLFDGSYILTSTPRYLELSNGGNLKWRNPGGGGTEDRQFWLEFAGYNISATLDCSTYYESFAGIKDLVQSICVFMTKATPLIEINETSLTDKQLADNYGNYYNSQHGINSWAFSTLFPMNTDFKDLGKSTGWYKVHEFDFEKVVATAYVWVDPVNTKGFYQDYGVREALKTDQFSHHVLTARVAYVYNDRLHLANIKTSVGLPYVLWRCPDDFVQMTTVTGKVIVSLKTTLGNVTRISSVNIPVYRKTADMTNYLVVPEVVGYNDFRAFKMQIIVVQSGSNYQLFNEALTKNEPMNFSFWHKTVFSLDNNILTGHTSNYSSTEIKTADIASYVSIASPSESGLPFDTNRLQVSEIQNPIVFPTKNSYQVGTGSIIAIRSRSIPLSTGQFGQFPLQVFTTSGNWAMEQGSGDVVYSNQLPVNGEVAINKDQIISLSYGVTYSTKEGLFVVSGIDVTDLTQLLIGSPNLALQAEQNYLLRLNRTELVQLVNSVSIVDAKTYILGAKVGFDCVNNELIVTNSLYNYSYVFSFESKNWFKISDSFDILINRYPQLLVVRENTNPGIFTLSVESFDGSIDVLLTTRPCKIDGSNVFTLIHRVIQRCELNLASSKYAGFYVFASNDLRKWQLLIGSDRKTGSFTDIERSRVHCKAKYFIFVFAACLTEGSSINEIDIQYYHKLLAKIR